MMMSEQIIVRQLPCVMTAAEKALKANELVAVLGTISDLEEEKKAATASLTARIKEEKKKGGELAQEVRTGKEVRPIQCYERFRYEADMVELVRDDTAEVVSTRAMDPRDRQEKLGYTVVGSITAPPEKRKGKGRKGELRAVEDPPELEQPKPDDDGPGTDGMH